MIYIESRDSMKKVIKSRIFLVIITTIIVASISVYAATTYNATDVLYTASDGTSMTVNDALNELYNKSGGKGYYYYYENGTAIYYNPVTGTTCDSSKAVSTTGTKTGCMKWYTFNDSSESSTVNMILDHNTTAGLAWNTDGTYGTNVAYESSKIKPEVDKLVSESGWVNTPRLITAEEVVQITGKTSWTNTSSFFYLDSNSATGTATSKGASNYAWLFDYTKGCTSYGCNVADSSHWGYWTSTLKGTAGSGSLVWDLNGYGRLGRHYASHTDIGVRPVITITKSKLS